MHEPVTPLPFLGATRCIKKICSGMACLLFFFFFWNHFRHAQSCTRTETYVATCHCDPQSIRLPVGTYDFTCWRVESIGAHRRCKGTKVERSHRPTEQASTFVVQGWSIAGACTERGSRRHCGKLKALFDLFVFGVSIINGRDMEVGRWMGPTPISALDGTGVGVRVTLKVGAQTLDFILSTSYLIIRSFSPYKNCYTCLWPSPSQKENLM